MNTLLIRTLDKRWRQAMPDFRKVVRRAVSCVLDLKNTEVSIVLADDAFVQTLNKEHRGMDKPTNVLSFPMPDMGLEIWQAGDMVLAYETVTKEALEQDKTLEAHFSHLLIHSALHLCGYDHMTDEEATQMEQIEIEKMKGLGFSDPYES